MNTLFDLSNVLIMPFWLALVLTPHGRLAARFMGRPWICALLALLYAGLILPNLASLLPLLMRPRLAEIQLLLGSPLGATAAWLHILALDLFLARAIWRDALARGVNSWFLRVCLVLNLLFGPLGLLLYGLGRVTTRKLTPPPSEFSA